MTEITEFVRTHRMRLGAAIMQNARGKMSHQKLFALVRRWEGKPKHPPRCKNCGWAKRMHYGECYSIYTFNQTGCQKYEPKEAAARCDKHD